MKNWVRTSVLIAALAPLASCIAVDDYGTAWERATIDKALTGSWKQIASRPDQTRAQGYGIGVISTYVEKGGAYEVSMYDAEGEADGEKPLYPIKTLRIGRYRFLAEPAPHGILERYVVRGEVLEVCMAIGPAQVDFQEQQYPNAVNIGKNHSEGEFLEVRVLDAEAERIIAAIPDTNEYWDCDWKFERTRKPAPR